MSLTPRFQKSSYSGGGNNCVEAATQKPDAVVVRDSKNPDGGVLTFTADQWRSFTAELKTGQSHLR